MMSTYTMPHDPTHLPSDLPIPTDDGRAAHLFRARIPPITLRASGHFNPATNSLTAAHDVNLADLARSPSVLFFYPRTGVPGQSPSLGFRGEEWDSIPGARGCTPQSCSFRDQHADFTRLGVRVVGVSTDTTDHQREFAARMHIPFDMLSDAHLELTRALRLPTFEFPVESGGPTTLLARMAWYCNHNVIEHVWYPVFPPNENAANVLSWLGAHRAP